MENAFRIQRIKPRTAAGGDGVGAMAAAGGGARDSAPGADTGDYKPPSYMEKLFKLIPAEIVALYLVGRSAVEEAFKSGPTPASGAAREFFTEPWAWGTWTMICLIGVVVVRMQLTSSSKDKVGPEWPAIGISAVAFLLWVYALGDWFKHIELNGFTIHYWQRYL